MKTIIWLIGLSMISTLALSRFAEGSVISTKDASAPAIKSLRLSNTMYVIEGDGGNVTASIGKDGVLLVDDGLSEMAKDLLTKLKELGGATPRLIINTHFHYDHTGGNALFGPTAVIIAASEVRSRLSSEQILWHEKHASLPQEALPIVSLPGSLTINFNSDEIKITHL